MPANHGLRNARPRPKDRSNPAGALRAFNLHKASYREPRRALKGRARWPPRLGRAWVATVPLVAHESADGKPYAFARSHLDVAHKLARACGGEVIDNAVDRMADSDFLNQSDEIQT